MPRRTATAQRGGGGDGSLPKNRPLLLVSGATTTVRRHAGHPHLGRLIQPRNRNRLDEVGASGMWWAADNDCFQGLDPDEYMTMLNQIRAVDTSKMVAEVYGGDEALERNARTGCIGCPLAEVDTALDYILTLPEWSYLAPLKRLRPLYRELRLFKWRLQKDGERNKDGRFSANPSRKGPLTMEARRMGLRTVVAVQREINQAARRLGRPRISLINWEEFKRIRELIAANTWPQRWNGDEPRGDQLIPQTYQDGTRQELLLTLEESRQ